jgi:hypothetical protein
MDLVLSTEQSMEMVRTSSIARQFTEQSAGSVLTAYYLPTHFQKRL